jgi:hypothetical protein
MSEMINNIEEAYQLVTSYTSKTSRPGLSDLITFDILMDMHESDNSDPYYWTTTPDVVMQHIIDSSEVFTVDYGWEDMTDAIRDYLTDNDFVKDIDDEEEEEENDN